MINYEIVYSQTAVDDLNSLFEVITHKFKSPLTAHRYLQGILSAINELKRFPEKYAIQNYPSLQQRYGNNIRRINYKRVAIIYVVQENRVIIQQVSASSIISE